MIKILTGILLIALIILVFELVIVVFRRMNRRD